MTNKKTSNRGGRPTQEQAGQIEERILDAAAALFFAQGYGAISIEEIARSAKISKRTFYARYANKAALFEAVVHRITHRLRPDEAIINQLFSGGDLESILRRVSLVILQATLTPQALAMFRVVMAEAVRFPELALIMHGQGMRQEAIERIAQLLEQHVKPHSADPLFAAEQLLQMITSAPQRRALGFGTPLEPAGYAAWVDATVHLFLQGYMDKNPLSR